MHARLDALLDADRQRRSVVDKLARAAAEEVIAKAAVAKINDHPRPVVPPGPATSTHQGERSVEIASNGGAVPSAPKSGREPNRFAEADPLEAVSEAQIDAALFFDAGYEGVLVAMVRHVVEVEGPILDTVLARRIARAHGFARTSARIQERVEQRAAGEFASTYSNRTVVTTPRRSPDDDSEPEQLVLL